MFELAWEPGATPPAWAQIWHGFNIRSGQLQHIKFKWLCLFTTSRAARIVQNSSSLKQRSKQYNTPGVVGGGAHKNTPALSGSPCPCMKLNLHCTMYEIVL